MDDRSAYEKKLDAQIAEWSAEIDKLKAQAQKADADARIELNDEVDRAKSQLNAAKDKLDELRNAGDGAWDDLKNGLEDAWSSVSTAIQEARSRFD